jgi:hypothetical protein
VTTSREPDTEAFDTVDSLVLDLLEWIGPTSRPYVEVMDAWRTSCPHLPVWEEASQRGYVRRRVDEGTSIVLVTPAGAAHLRRGRPTYLTATRDTPVNEQT